mgnify:CR=1 FL=1
MLRYAMDRYYKGGMAQACGSDYDTTHVLNLGVSSDQHQSGVRIFDIRGDNCIHFCRIAHRSSHYPLV